MNQVNKEFKRAFSRTPANANVDAIRVAVRDDVSDTNYPVATALAVQLEAHLAVAIKL